jgi:hypothetical protein
MNRYKNDVIDPAQSKPVQRSPKPAEKGGFFIAVCPRMCCWRRMGYYNSTMTGHGFRAMARTILDAYGGSILNAD